MAEIGPPVAGGPIADDLAQALLTQETTPPAPAEQTNATPGDEPQADSITARLERLEAEAGPVGSPETASGLSASASSAEAAPIEEPGSLELLGERIPRGTSRRLTWSASEVFEGISTATPVLVVNGSNPGPVLCLTAALHGDELNGIEMVRRVMHELDPNKLNGAVIGVPIVNLQGFRRGSRYLPDRRDLNRYFPGNPEGSSAARIAYSFFETIVRRCDILVDLHTGSFYRTNLPQLRADLRYPSIREVTQGFGGMVVMHSAPAAGTLRRAATDAGIPTVTLEAGEPLRLQSGKVAEGVNGIFALMGARDMVSRVQLLGQAEPVFYQSAWVRADHGGILFSVVRLGQVVDPGDVLGTVTDPITNEQNLIYASARGRILGMAVNQVVMPGFAAFRIGMETDGPPDGSVIAAAEWGKTELSEDEADGPRQAKPPKKASQPILEVEETS